jgi:SPP1 family predicted phage head-tail adaptor
MEVVQTSSRELWYAQQVHPDITCMVKTRYVDGVTANMRVVWEDGTSERILHIGAPPLSPDGRRQELVMMCMERE